MKNTTSRGISYKRKISDDNIQKNTDQTTLVLIKIRVLPLQNLTNIHEWKWYNYFQNFHKSN